MKPLFRQDKKRTENIRVRSYELVRPILALDFNDGVAGPRGSRCWRQLVEVLEDLSLQWHRYAVISQIINLWAMYCYHIYDATHCTHAAPPDSSDLISSSISSVIFDVDQTLK